MTLHIFLTIYLRQHGINWLRNMVNEPQIDLSTVDVERVAEALGVDPCTLPRADTMAASEPPRRPVFEPLSDDEWEVVVVALPELPVPKPDANWNDRTFIDAVLWWIAAKAQGYSWHRLPQELGPQSSREHRHRRWVLLGNWIEIAVKLACDGRLSPERIRAFQRLAEDAVARKASLLARRARMTDAI